MKESLKGRAFDLMLKVKRELTLNMLTFPGNHFTIREVSEDNASIVIERALRAAEHRGMAAQRRLARAARRAK